MTCSTWRFSATSSFSTASGHLRSRLSPSCLTSRRLAPRPKSSSIVTPSVVAICGSRLACAVDCGLSQWATMRWEMPSSPASSICVNPAALRGLARRCPKTHLFLGGGAACNALAHRRPLHAMGAILGAEKLHEEAAA